MMMVMPVIPAMAAYNEAQDGVDLVGVEPLSTPQPGDFRWNKFNANGTGAATVAPGFNLSLYNGGAIRIWSQFWLYGTLADHVQQYPGQTGYRWENQNIIMSIESATLDDGRCAFELNLIRAQTVNQITVAFGRSIPRVNDAYTLARGDRAAQGIYSFPWHEMTLVVQTTEGPKTVILTNHFNLCPNCDFDDCCDYCQWQVHDFCEYCGECLNCSDCLVFGLNVFNNGTINAPGIPNQVRMWAWAVNADGDSVPALPAPSLEISAYLPDGEAASHFISYISIHPDDSLNLIDVSFGVNNTEWSVMYVHVTVFYCQGPVTVRLVNPHIWYDVTIIREVGAVGVYQLTTTTVSVQNGQPITADLLPNYNARTGFYFAGWYPEHPTDFGPIYESGLVFTARYNLLWHPVTFIAGPGGAATSPRVENIRAGTAIGNVHIAPPGIIPMVQPLPGYRFVEWYPENPVGIVPLPDTDNFPPARAMTFTALFEIDPCDICPDCGECAYCDDGCLDFRWDAFNNGVGLDAYPSRDNPGLAASGTIRMWTGFGPVAPGPNTPLPLHVAETITAYDQDGNCVMSLVTVNRVWVDGEGWQDYFLSVDVNKNIPWQYITLTIIVCGVEYPALLVNSRIFSLDLFNNGPEGCASTPNESLADAGLIRMWTQWGGVTTDMPYRFADSIVATVRGSNECAVYLGLIRVNQFWDEENSVWAGYFANIDVTKTDAWEFIDFEITVFGQTVEVVLHNGTFNEDRSITFNFPGLHSMRVQYWIPGAGWHELAGGPFANYAQFNAPGATVVRAVRDGLVYSHTITPDGTYVIDAPVIRLYVRGVPVGGNTLGVVGGGFGSNWVYNGIPAEVYPNENYFFVFDNRDYEVRLNRTGFFPLGRMSSRGYDDGYYLYVDLSAYLVTITVPEGVTNVRMQSNGWIVNPAHEGDVIWLVVDRPNYRDAIVTFDYCCLVQHRVYFILDGQNPLYIVCCDNNGPIINMANVIFANGGGTGTMDSVEVQAGTEFILPANGFTAPTGYEFYGWHVTGYADPDGPMGPDSEIIVGLPQWPNTNVTVTAVWTPIAATTTTVSFDAGDGSGTMESVSVSLGEDFDLPANGFTAPAGYEFYGWWISGYADPLGTVQPDDTIEVGGPVTALALWVAVTQPPPVVPGDINGDGFVDWADFSLLVRYVGGEYGVEIIRANADLNGDGYIDQLDIDILRHFLETGTWPLP